MFSTGHLIWIGISAALIVGGFAACVKKKASVDQVLKVCFVLGICSEVVKVFSVANILPMVEPVIASGAQGPVLEYSATGQYSPYIEMAHLPLELCSLQLVFMASAIWLKDSKWKDRFLTLMFPTGIIGGSMGILMAYITSEYTTVRSYFASPRVWQFFLYHAMVVLLALYIGYTRKEGYSRQEIRRSILAIISMDAISFYINSVFSQPVYIDGTPVGLVYRVNFFSSYVNPLGLILTEKWQWIAYLMIRGVLAVSLLLLLFLVHRMMNPMRAAAKQDEQPAE